jgi:Na+/H+ antiporter NhaA
MTQTRFSSFLEACFNTAIGFVMSMLLSIVVYPMFGHSFTLTQNVGITLIFTVASILRGYVVRRWFNARIHEASQRLAGGVA